MSSVVADTHTIVWYLFHPQNLSVDALTALDTATNQGEIVYISAISLIEVTYLIEKGRLAPETTPRLNAALTDPETGIELVPIGLNIASVLAQIDRETVPDMPDRIIAATALSFDLPLVIRDCTIQQAPQIRTIW